MTTTRVCAAVAIAVVLGLPSGASAATRTKAEIVGGESGGQYFDLLLERPRCGDAPGSKPMYFEMWGQAGRIAMTRSNECLRFVRRSYYEDAWYVRPYRNYGERFEDDLTLFVRNLRDRRQSWQYRLVVGGKRRSYGRLRLRIIRGHDVYEGTREFRRYCLAKARPIRTRDGRQYCRRPNQYRWRLRNHP